MIDIAFDHGLGDCANFAHMLPLWLVRGHQIRLHCRPDKAPLFRAVPGLRVVCGSGPRPPDGGQPDVRPRRHPWNHPPANARGLAAQSKTGHNLTEILPQIGTREDLWYELLDTRLTLDSVTSPDERQTVDAWLQDLPRPLILIHTRANTSAHAKDLPDNLTIDLYKLLLAATPGTVIALDWDRRAPPYKHDRYRHIMQLGRPHLPELWHLLSRADLLIGVDSGPLHFARFTTCPCIGYWRGHSPHRFALPRFNTRHLARRGLCPGEALAPYRVTETAADPTPADLAAAAQTALDTPRLTADHYGVHYLDEHRRWGLNYMYAGNWQRHYGQSVAALLGWAGRRVLDIGCAAGALTWGLRAAGIDAHGCDLCEPFILAGRKARPDVPLAICDAANLYLYRDAEFAGTHSHMTAEHWPPDLVPRILREMLRVTRHAGIAAMLYADPTRGGTDNDPTHLCLRPRAWWHARATAAGWDVVTDEYLPQLARHNLDRPGWTWSFLRRPA